MSIERDALVTLINKKVHLNIEVSKTDFKREFKREPKAELVRLMKLISAIANSDSEEDSDCGFIIFGAAHGQWLQEVPFFNPDEKDHLSASLRQTAKSYLYPVPEFHLLEIPTSHGFGGAIIIPPSEQQPHQFVREFSDEKLTIRRGDWYIRNSDSTDLASAEDLNRIFVKRIGREVAPFTSRLVMLEERLFKLEAQVTEQSNTAMLELDVIPGNGQNYSVGSVEIFVTNKSPFVITSLMAYGDNEDLRLRERPRARHEIPDELEAGSKCRLYFNSFYGDMPKELRLEWLNPNGRPQKLKQVLR